MKKMNIALVAHDSRKKEMIEWVKYNYRTLSQHNLLATGTTGRLIEEIEIRTPQPSPTRCIDTETGLYETLGVMLTSSEFPFRGKVTRLFSGPLGGDAQISALIAEDKIDALIFFCDTLTMQGHNADIQGLSRIAGTYNVAFATNRTTADMVLTSPLFGSETYERIIPECIEKYKNRKLD